MTVKLTKGWLMRDVQEAARRVKEMGWDITWFTCRHCDKLRNDRDDHICRVKDLKST